MRSLTTFDTAAGDGVTGRLIPRPDIPLQPVLSLATFLPYGGVTAPAVVDSGSVALVTAGRIAIALALEQMGVRPGEKVLIPAYHCIAMVEPLTRFAAQPVFYALHEDLSVDLDDIESKLDGDTRVLMVPHYFGMPQDMPAIRSFCDAHGVWLIEDCAHSFFGSHGGQPLGSFGDCTIASLTKFFPVRDGGCLVVSDRMRDRWRVTLREQSLSANLATLLDSIEDANDYGRLPLFKPAIALVRQAKHMVRRMAPSVAASRTANPAQQRGGVHGEFDAAWLGTRMSAVSRLIYDLSARSRSVALRRKNYQFLAAAFASKRGVRPLFPKFPDGAVPFMFPLWVDRLPAIFGLLEEQAVPMQRFGQFLWPGADAGVCSHSAELSRYLIQIPCHQELGEMELGAIVDKIYAVAC